MPDEPSSPNRTGLLQASTVSRRDQLNTTIGELSAQVGLLQERIDRLERIAATGLARNLNHPPDTETTLAFLMSLGDAAMPVLRQILTSRAQPFESNDVRALRERVLWVLADLGDRTIIPNLLARLGDYTPSTGDTVSLHERVTQSLRKLGEVELVEAFEQTLQGEASGLSRLKAMNRPEVGLALLRAIETPAPRVIHAARALADLGVIDALPTLRAKSAIYRFSNPRHKKIWDQAVEQLEAFSALPRTSASPAEGGATLPRPADEAEPAEQSLIEDADR